MKDASDILKTAQQHLLDRATVYDNKKERSIDKVVNAFNSITDHNLSNKEGWLFMSILKMVRAQHENATLDSFEDCAAYVALMGEEALPS